MTTAPVAAADQPRPTPVATASSAADVVTRAAAAPLDRLGLPSVPDVERLVAQRAATSPDFRVGIQRYRNTAEALRHQGLIHWQAGDVREAIDAFKAAVVLSPEDPDLWRDLAGTFVASGQADLALSCLSQSLRHGPHEARSWLMLASLSQHKGNEADAEASFLQAITLDPTLGEAHFGLGLLSFAGRRLDAAALSLRAAIANGYANAIGFLALGHLLSLTGDFFDCAAAFEAAAAFAPLDRAARRKWARARAFSAMLDGTPDAALATYAAQAGTDAEDEADVLRDAFSVLSAYGHRDAAAGIGRMRLARNPDDVVQRYLLDAVTGRSLSKAPLDYLETYFDRFAATFEQTLVDVLHYDVPIRLVGLIAAMERRFGRILDLGCGTGLAAPHLAPLATHLIGLDISSRMLEKAADRAIYTALVQADALSFLSGEAGLFDLVFAADVLIYFGDLAPLFAAVARSLPPGGLFAATFETGPTVPYALLPSGRFAHAPAFLDTLAAPDFTIAARQETVIRLEAGAPVQGLMMVFERRGSTSLR